MWHCCQTLVSLDYTSHGSRKSHLWENPLFMLPAHCVGRNGALHNCPQLLPPVSQNKSNKPLSSAVIEKCNKPLLFWVWKKQPFTKLALWISGDTDPVFPFIFRAYFPSSCPTFVSNHFLRSRKLLTRHEMYFQKLKCWGPGQQLLSHWNQKLVNKKLHYTKEVCKKHTDTKSHILMIFHYQWLFCREMMSVIT